MRFSWFLALSTMIVLSANGASSSGDEERPLLPADVLLVARSASPHALVEKLSALAAAAETELPAELLPSLLWGDQETPLPEGISRTANVGFALVLYEGDRVPVLLVRLQEGSPYGDLLAEFGFTLSESGDWTFAVWGAHDAEELGDLPGLLIQAVETPRRNDFEIDVNLDEIAREVRTSAEDSRRLFERLFDETGPAWELQQGLAYLYNWLAAELESVERFRANVTLTPAGIHAEIVVSAHRGTALAALMRVEHGPSIAPASWLSGESEFLFLGGFDSGALHTYWDPLLATLEETGGPLFQQLFPVARNREMLRLLAAAGKIGRAGAISLEADPPSFIQVSEVTLAGDDLHELLQATARRMSDGREATLLTTEDSKHDLYVLEPEEADDESSYFALASGTLLMGNSAELTLETAERISSGAKPAESAARFFREEDGLVLQVVINTAALFAFKGPLMAPDDVARPAALPPIEATLQVHDGKVVGRFSLPSPVIAEIHREIQRLTNVITEEDLEFEL